MPIRYFLTALCLLLGVGQSACETAAPTPTPSAQPSPAPTNTPASDPATLITQARQAVASALGSYGAGRNDEAYETAAGAYLTYIEPLEPALEKQDAAFVTELEGHFKDLRDSIKA